MEQPWWPVRGASRKRALVITVSHTGKAGHGSRRQRRLTGAQQVQSGEGPIRALSLSRLSGTDAYSIGDGGQGRRRRGPPANAEATEQHGRLRGRCSPCRVSVRSPNGGESTDHHGCAPGPSSRSRYLDRRRAAPRELHPSRKHGLPSSAVVHGRRARGTACFWLRWLTAVASRRTTGRGRTAVAGSP